MSEAIKTQIKQLNIIDNQFVDDFFDTIEKSNTPIIDLDKAYKWLGYAEKKSVKRILIKPSCNFQKNVDYIISENNDSGNIKKHGGSNIEKIMITGDCFKMLAMLSRTEMGNKTRKYYIELEKLYMKNLNEKNQSINNPLPKIHSTLIDFDSYADKEVLYLLLVKDNIYKYGISADIRDRLKRHKITFNYQAVIKIWLCKNRTISAIAEAKVKEFTKVNKINITYGIHTEIFQANDINNIITNIDKIVEREIDNYEEEHNINQKEKLLDKIYNGNLGKLDNELNEFYTFQYKLDVFYFNSNN